MQYQRVKKRAQTSSSVTATLHCDQLYEARISDRSEVTQAECREPKCLPDYERGARPTTSKSYVYTMNGSQVSSLEDPSGGDEASPREDRLGKFATRT